MVIIIKDRISNKLFSFYSEDNKTPWESDDVEQVIDKYNDIKNKLPVLGIFENLTKIVIEGKEPIQPELLEILNQINELISGIKVDISEIDSAMQDFETRLSMLEGA